MEARKIKTIIPLFLRITPQRLTVFFRFFESGVVLMKKADFFETPRVVEGVVFSIFFLRLTL